MTDQSRRAFLKRAAAVSVIVGGAAPFVMNLAAIGEAAAATASDYKALVCIFLFGGNDYANTVMPYDQPSYDLYASLRGTIAHSRDSLAQTILFPNTALPGARQYALAPTLAPLVPLFDAGQLAVVLNVGTLVQPTSKTTYTNKSVPLPPKLFSTTTSRASGRPPIPKARPRAGAGGSATCSSPATAPRRSPASTPSGNSVFLSRQDRGPIWRHHQRPGALAQQRRHLFGSATGMSTLRALMTGPRTHLFEDEHARVTKRSLDLQAQVSAALAAGPAIATPSRPATASPISCASSPA